MRFFSATVSISLFALLATSCGGSPRTPHPFTTIPAGTHQSAIVMVSGTGAGGVSVTPKSVSAATFAADISISIEKARPNTTYFVQRAPEIGRTLGSDGVCQRALGLSPWSAADPAAPAFITFQMPNAGPAVTMTTSTTGSASMMFEFVAPTIAAGTMFEVMSRLVDSESAPRAELRSGCLTVLVK
jgi:hypothetical protein